MDEQGQQCVGVGRAFDEDRLRLEWISASEGEKYSRVSWEMETKIRELGPLELQP